MLRPLTFPLSCLASTLAVAAPAEPPTRPTQVALEPVVVVAQRRAEPLDQVAANVSLVEREQLDRRLASQPADLLHGVPGVSLDSDSQRFGAVGPSIRGLGGNRVRIELDGVPLPETFAVGQFARALRDFGELGLLERVEVLRGPASTLYGSDALAGIIALHSRGADGVLEADSGRHLGWKLGHDGRDSGDLRQLSGAFATPSGWHGLLLGAERESGSVDNRADSAALQPNPARRQNHAVLAKFGFRGDGLEWQLSGERQALQQATDVRTQRFAPGRFATTYLLLGDDHHQRERLSLDFKLAPDGGPFEQYDLLLYGQQADSRQDSEQYRLPDRTTAFESLRWRRFVFEQDERGADLLGQRRIDGGRWQHELLAGLEWQHTRYRGLRDGFEVNLGTGARSSVVLGERFPVRDFPTSLARREAVFIQSESRYGRFSVIPGLRYERYRLDAHPDALFREDFPELTVVDRRSSRFTGKLGLRYALAPRQQAFLHYTEGFRAPPFSDLNIGLSLTLLNYEVRPNPALRPERSEGFEAGWRYAGEHLHASVAVYRNRYRDLIDSRANLGVDPDSGALVFQSINRGAARIEGAEVELTWELAGWSESLRDLQLRAGLASSRGQDLRRQQPLNSIEPASAVLGLEYAHASGRWGGEAVATAVAGKRRIDHSAGSLFAPPGHAVIDLFGWVDLGSSWRAHVGVFNLSDRRYWRWASVRGLAASDGTLDFYSQPGRAWSLSLSYRWR